MIGENAFAFVLWQTKVLLTRFKSWSEELGIMVMEEKTNKKLWYLVWLCVFVVL